MKLRQKLAAVLAATMVVTAVPVVTMAASTNRITKSLTVAKDAKIGFELNDAGTEITKSDVPKLIIKATDEITSGSIFFVKIKEGEFADLDKITNEATPSNATVKRLSSSELQITVPNTIAVDDIIELPIYASAKNGEVVVEVIPENSTVSFGSFVIARTNEAKSTISVGDATSFYTEGKVAKITLEESYVGAFAAGANDDGDVIVKLTIDHDDFKFMSGKATLGRGIAAKTVNITVDSKDEQVAYATFKKADVANASARGTMVIEDLAVKSTTKAPDTGDFNITVGGDLVTEKSVKVANVADYGVNLKMKDDKAVEIKEGRTDKVTFTLAENVNDSMNNGRPVEFTLENGHFSHTTDGAIKIGKIKLGDDTLTSTQYEIDTIEDADDNIIGFEFALKGKNLSNTDIDKLTFEEVVVHAPLGNTGDIKLKAEGRMIGEEIETTAVTIKDAVEVETEAMTVKVGLKDQKGGKIVISETEKGNFKKGEKLVFDIEDGSGRFTDEPTVTVTEGDLKLSDVDTKITKEGKLEITIKRASKEASTIEIKDFVVDVDRTVPQGGFDLTVSGAAVTDCGTLTVEDFFKVGTPNTEDITNGMRKGTATFTNGAKAYTVNGIAHEMDAAAYISKAGRMMLPVRYVSEAFGVEGNNVIFADGTVTILAGTRTLQLKNGSEVAVLNGAQIKMAEKVVITNGRTYVPVGEVGRLLGVAVSFDDATKTATFENK